MSLDERSLEEVRRRAETAGRILVFTGAGVSAESGVPTYRGQGGLWKNFRAQDLASLEAFRRDPVTVWGWYRERRRKLLAARPNPAHTAVARAAEQHPLTLATQNIDGLHTFAGSREPLELHGNIWRERCLRCLHHEDRSHLWREGLADAEDAPLPECPVCRNLLRPDIIWFGEQLDQAVLEGAFAAAENCGLCLVIGTSGEVQPAALVPILARRAGAFVVEVNIEPSLLTDKCHASLFGPAGEILPRIFPAASA